MDDDKVFLVLIGSTPGGIKRAGDYQRIIDYEELMVHEIKVSIPDYLHSEPL